MRRSSPVAIIHARRRPPWRHQLLHRPGERRRASGACGGARLSCSSKRHGGLGRRSDIPCPYTGIERARAVADGEQPFRASVQPGRSAGARFAVLAKPTATVSGSAPADGFVDRRAAQRQRRTRRTRPRRSADGRLRRPAASRSSDHPRSGTGCPSGVVAGGCAWRKIAFQPRPRWRAVVDPRRVRRGGHRCVSRPGARNPSRSSQSGRRDRRPVASTTRSAARCSTGRSIAARRSRRA